MLVKLNGATRSSLCILLLLLVCILPFALLADGQWTIPIGTIVPLRLNGTLSSKNSKPNQRISARVMQDVPLQGGGKIREGAKITGHVIDVRPAKQV